MPECKLHRCQPAAHFVALDNGLEKSLLFQSDFTHVTNQEQLPDGWSEARSMSRSIQSVRNRTSSPPPTTVSANRPANNSFSALVAPKSDEGGSNEKKASESRMM